MTYVIAEARVEEGPVEAIYYEDDLPGRWRVNAGENAGFFAAGLPPRR